MTTKTKNKKGPSLKRKNGKFILNKVPHEKMMALKSGIESYENQLLVYCETLSKTEHWKDWSICKKIHDDLQKKTNCRVVQDHYQLSFELHELFVFFAILTEMQRMGDGYNAAVALGLVFLVHPYLPSTEKTRNLELFSRL